MYKNTRDYVPILLLWDVTTKLVATAVATLPRFSIGFLLEDGVLARGGSGSVNINPLSAHAFITGNRSQAHTIALWFYELACHELAHLRAGHHGEAFSVQREALGQQAAGIVPLIEETVIKVLKLEPTRVPRLMLTRTQRALDELAQDKKSLTTHVEELRGKYNNAAMDRDVARRELKAVQDRVASFETSTPQQSARRIGALAATLDYRKWIIDAGRAFGFDEQRLQRALNEHPDVLVNYLLGEGSGLVGQYMTAIGDSG